MCWGLRVSVVNASCHGEALPSASTVRYRKWLSCMQGLGAKNLQFGTRDRMSFERNLENCSKGCWPATVTTSMAAPAIRQAAPSPVNGFFSGKRRRVLTARPPCRA